MLRIPVPTARGGLLVVALALLAALMPAPAAAVEIGGSLFLFWIDNDFESSSTNNTEQQFTLNLSQELSPFLTVRLRSRYFDLDSRSGGREVFSRRFRQPSLDLIYSRPSLSARLAYDYSLADGTSNPGDFESRSLNGSLLWRIRQDLSLNLSFRDEVNELDVGSLGRDTANKQARGLLLYRRPHWSSSYSYGRTEVENRSNGLKSDQDRHDLRLDASRDFLNRRLSLSFSGDLGHSKRSDVITEGADLAEPVPAATGLFAIDPTPELGELEVARGLVDGDFAGETIPVIEIGGANTFRNIGLDLGFTRQVSRLEIAVDRPSGSTVGWEVYRSRDNLFWERVLGSRAEYDGDRLRYTLVFPDVEDRFFKAVNVSTNSEPNVRVTEIRALRELPTVEEMRSLELNLYRLDAFASFRFSNRVRGRLAFGASNDDTRVADLVTQDREEESGSGGLEVDLTDTLKLNLGYRWAEELDGREPGLDRTSRESNMSLAWTPLPTMDAMVSATDREESSEEGTIQNTRSARLAIGLQLLPDLRLLSEVNSSRIEDPFTGVDRDTMSWSQRLEAHPLPNWRLAGGYNYLETQTSDQEQLFERTNVFVDTSWIVGSYLTLTGTWRLFEDAIGDSLRQNYGLVYSPGPKLTLTASWEEFDSDLRRLTGSDSLGLTYRLYRGVFLSARLSRSRTATSGGPIEEITSGQTGLRIRF